MNPRSDPGRTGAAAITLLALVGLALSAYLTYLHVRLHHDPTYVSVCALGEKVNCETVAASSHSVYLDLPVSIWGVFGYLVLGWTALIQFKRGRQAAGAGLLALYGVLLALVSAVLAAISSFLIGALCLLCTATYLVNLAVAVVAATRSRRRGGVIACIGADLRRVLERPAPIARTGAVLLLAVVAAQIFVPKYWELASWRQGVYGATGVTEDGYPWIGAENPKLTIHEYLDYECPHCKIAHRKLRRILVEHPDELRLVRHDYARMACQPNDAKRRRESCAMARAGFCASDFGAFWEWNDAVMAKPRPLNNPERKTYIPEMAETLGFDADRFDDCLYSARTVERAQTVYLDARKHKITETPGFAIDGETRVWEQVRQIIDDRL